MIRDWKDRIAIYCLAFRRIPRIVVPSGMLRQLTTFDDVHSRLTDRHFYAADNLLSLELTDSTFASDHRQNA